jgi:hypothetical protein
VVTAWLLLAALAQEPAPHLVEGTVEAAVSGELGLKSNAGYSWRCTLDAHTHRDGGAALARPGDRLEGWLWQADGSGCRWLSLRLISRDLSNRPRLRLNLNPLESVIQRGNLMLAGTVVSQSADRFVLRARDGSRQTVLLRPDTHILAEGLKVPASEIPSNRLLFVRAGHNLDGHVEAFRIAWGSIVQPAAEPRP